MSANQKEIDNLLRTAKHSTDPESLWQIAARLEALGAWDEARRVETMAHDAEVAQYRKQAVRA